MKIEGVIVSVQYGDFLAHSLLYNRRHFDKLVVVTDLADDHTRNLCKYHHVECVSTDEFYRDDAAFNKGRGINEGLKRLSGDGFVIHMDADVILPPRAKELLNTLPLDETKIYGIDRMMCTSYEDWLRHITHPELQHQGEAYVTATSFPLGSRLAWTNEVGYLPVGFFQMWSPAGSEVACYPVEHGEAARADVAFAMKWPRHKRELLPEIVAIHLESQPSVKGANWRGRRTRSFDLPGMNDPIVAPGHVSSGGYMNRKMP